MRWKAGNKFTTFSNASGAGQSFLEKKPPNEVVAEAWLGLASWLDGRTCSSWRRRWKESSVPWSKIFRRAGGGPGTTAPGSRVAGFLRGEATQQSQFERIDLSALDPSRTAERQQCPSVGQRNACEEPWKMPH